MAGINQGPWGWSMTRDDEGHREYTIRHKVYALHDDGPAVVMQTAGLPAIGSYWQFGNDVDIWAFCRPDMKVAPIRASDHPFAWWWVDQKFSTRPITRCQDESIEDPLLEPQRYGGSFVKYTQEVMRDRNGDLIKTSSHEIIRGQVVEFDHNRPTVWIEQNTAALGLATFAQMVDTVNGAALWGLGTRKIKLSNVSWERRLYGLCNFYYTRRFEFDINFKGYDRKSYDEGNKVLNGHHSDTGAWVLDDINGAAPDPDNPLHFIRYKDRNDQLARALLDGAGKPLSGAAAPVEIDIEYYDESDFLTLGVPTSF